MDTVAFADLPEDLQCYIFELVEEMDPECDPDQVIPDELSLGTIPLHGLPVVPLDENDRGTAYALDMQPGEAPPIVVAHGHFLDGKHRVFAARARSDEAIDAIDLSEILPVRNIENYSMGAAVGFERNVSAGPSI